MIRLGLALTRHCNLRCPHCIRDDVSAVQSLELSLIRRLLDEATSLFGGFAVSLTGGEPLLHPEFGGIIEALGQRNVPWRVVSNGWHVPRELPRMAAHPPELLVLSLSGADEAVHDDERGRGSFQRVLLSAGALRSRGIPATLSMVVDRRDRHQLEQAVRLARDLHVRGMDFILPQPVPGSMARDSDLPPAEWPVVRDEVRALASQYEDDIVVTLAYGAPSPHGEPEAVCDTKQLKRLYVDPDGRLSLCCQLSEYGENRADTVADLHHGSLASAMASYRGRMSELKSVSAPPGRSDADTFPCMRCARALGKLDWLQRHPGTPWGRLHVATSPDRADGAARRRTPLPVLTS